jgi:hypothetical protein
MLCLRFDGSGFIAISCPGQSTFSHLSQIMGNKSNTAVINDHGHASDIRPGDLRETDLGLILIVAIEGHGLLDRCLYIIFGFPSTGSRASRPDFLVHSLATDTVWTLSRPVK